MKTFVVFLVCVLVHVNGQLPHICKLCVCECHSSQNELQRRESFYDDYYVFHPAIFFLSAQKESFGQHSCRTLPTNAEKVIHIDCSSENNVGDITNLNWTIPTASVIYGDFQNSRWSTFEHFPDSVKSKLVRLSVSENKIGRTGGFSGFEKLQTLNISFNQLKDIQPSTFEKLINLKELDVSNNNIQEVDAFSFNTNKELTFLNLSHNHIQSLVDTTFHGCIHLKVLDLSHNPLSILGGDIFRSTAALQYLFLNHLGREDLTYLPQKLSSLSIAGNNISEITTVLPADLRFVDISDNQISNITPILQLSQLLVLNCSHNNVQVQQVPVKSNVEVLDLSYNKLEELPSCISPMQLPKLRRMYLDGNDFTDLNIRTSGSFEHLQFISLSYQPHLEKIQGASFQGVLSGTNQDCNKTTGLHLRLSHNKNLQTIDRNAFQSSNLCEVDLSDNNLKVVSNMLLNWKSLRSINLQGNPWQCDCSNQWMLDDLLPMLYDKEQKMLLDLRCGSPEKLAGKHLAYWYDRTHDIFCGKRETSAYVSRAGSIVMELGNDIAYIIPGISICVLLILVIIGLIWDTRLRRRRVRYSPEPKHKNRNIERTVGSRINQGWNNETSDSRRLIG